MFKKIEAAIKKEQADYKRRALDYIRNGGEYDKDAGLRRYLTATMWSKYTAGDISRTEAIKKATARAGKKYDKDTAGELATLARIANAGRLKSVSICVEWKKSRVWGYNPTATALIEWVTPEGFTRWGRYYGHASGCGYDKRSAAVADALNQCDAVLNIMYSYANKHYNKDIRTGGRAICYGLGYSSRPYFEGGVGVSCFRKAFELCGFEWVENTASEYTDFYYITRGRK